MRKKSILLSLILSFIFILTSCGNTKDADADFLFRKDQIETSCIRLMDELQSMNEADLYNTLSYYESLADSDEGAALNVTLLTDYIEGKEGLGEFLEYGEFTLDETGKTMTATLPAKYENGDIELVYVMNTVTNKVTAINVNKVLPLSEIMKTAGLNTVMGISIVFLILVLISLLIYCFKFISVIENKIKKKNEEKREVPFEKELKEETVSASSKDNESEELIAVIAAAIAASTGLKTDDFVVRSIRRVGGGK